VLWHDWILVGVVGSVVYCLGCAHDMSSCTILYFSHPDLLLTYFLHIIYTGAIKFLANNGVIPPPKQLYYIPERITNIKKVDLYSVVYPFTTGHMIYYDQRNLYYAIQSIMDYTLEFLNKNPKLDLTPNTFDFNDMRDPEHTKSTVRCDHRNNWVHNKNVEATRQWQAKENKANTKAHSIKKKVGRKISPMRQSRKKNKNTGCGDGGTQHPPQDRFVSSGAGGEGGTKKKKQSNNSRNNNKEKNGKKKGPRDSTNDMKHNKQHGGEGGKAKNKKNKSNDITSRLGKLGI